MARVLDLNWAEETREAELNVQFSVPEAGWIGLYIRPLHDEGEIACSEVFDPFSRYLIWLEQIAGGATTATWYVDEEGHHSALHFYGSLVDHGIDYLAHINLDRRGLTQVRGVIVQRRQVVEAFYGAFRTMTAATDYYPREWERHPLYPLIEEWDEEEYSKAESDYPYSGSRLRQLTSPTVEAYLKQEDDRQLVFDPDWRRPKRR